MSIIIKSPTKHCVLDPLPTWLLKASTDVLIQLLIDIVNTCLATGDVPDVLKQANHSSTEKSITGQRGVKKLSPRF